MSDKETLFKKLGFVINEGGLVDFCDGKGGRSSPYPAEAKKLWELLAGECTAPAPQPAEFSIAEIELLLQGLDRLRFTGSSKSVVERLQDNLKASLTRAATPQVTPTECTRKTCKLSSEPIPSLGTSEQASPTRHTDSSTPYDDMDDMWYDKKGSN